MKHLIKKLLREGLNKQVSCDIFTDIADIPLLTAVEQSDLYYYVMKKKRVVKVHISPDEYFVRISNNDTEAYLKRNEEIGTIDWSYVKKQVQKMKDGVKFNIPHLERYRGEYTGGHEGRHRVLAAKELGCEKIPVYISDDISDTEILELANKVVGLNTDDMRKAFTEMGFKDLDNNFNSIVNTLRRIKDENDEGVEADRKKEEERLRKQVEYMNEIGRIKMFDVYFGFKANDKTNEETKVLLYNYYKGEIPEEYSRDIVLWNSPDEFELWMKTNSNNSGVKYVYDNLFKIT